MSKTLILKPVLSEKTYAQSAKRVFAFEVPTDSNKHDVARAVEAQFDVTVTGVNILSHSGKAKRTISAKGRRVRDGREAAVKKAYVTLAEGNSLPFFAAIEEEDAKAVKAQEQIDKAAEKAAAKETKTGILGRKKKEETK